MLENTVKEADLVIGRLLHYFPQEKKSDKNEIWCGVHNDFGSLTGLCSAMFFDKDRKEVDVVSDE